MLNDQLQLRHYDDKDDGFEYEGQNKSSSVESNNHRTADHKNLAIDELDSAKFALFCKWLNESNFERKAHDVKDSVSSQSIERDSSDDEFVDTNNEPSISEQQFRETLPLVIEKANISSTVHEKDSLPTAVAETVVHEINQIDKLEPEKKLEPVSVDHDHIYETLVKIPSQTNLLELPNQSLLSLNLSCTSSASDLTSENGNSRRPASHKKGKAPPVPSAMAQPTSDDNIAETVPQEKEKKKKNLLTYIPSIFKPITPSNSSKNLTKETDIF